MDPITSFSSRTVTIATRDIDTDQIIPARFLTTTSRAGLGEACFADHRRRPDGSVNEAFPLAKPDAERRVLVAGANFGCGSSREHAPWALLDFGIRAVVSTQIADIFRGNAARNGLLPIIVDEGMHRWLMEHDGARVTIDLEKREIAAEGGPTGTFPFDPFAAYCLINGCDELGFLLGQDAAIAQFEEAQS